MAWSEKSNIHKGLEGMTDPSDEVVFKYNYTVFIFQTSF